jgi:hypothetical protein
LSTTAAGGTGVVVELQELNATAPSSTEAAKAERTRWGIGFISSSDVGE